MIARTILTAMAPSIAFMTRGLGFLITSVRGGSVEAELALHCRIAVGVESEDADDAWMSVSADAQYAFPWRHPRGNCDLGHLSCPLFRSAESELAALVATFAPDFASPLLNTSNVFGVGVGPANRARAANAATVGAHQLHDDRRIAVGADAEHDRRVAVMVFHHVADLPGVTHGDGVLAVIGLGGGGGSRVGAHLPCPRRFRSFLDSIISHANAFVK